MKKLIPALCSALALTCTVLAFAPLRVYAGNVLEFEFPLSHLLLVSLAASLLAALLLALLLAGLPTKSHEKAVALTVMLAILAWVQGNVLVWGYGSLDGRDIPWGNFRIQGIVDVAVWAALLIAAWAASGFFRRQAMRIALVLLLIQVLGTGAELLRMPAPSRRTDYDFDTSGQFVFSSERNILLLMPDAFQGNVFQELIASEPEWREAFPGFIHFPDALGGYSGTLFTVPFILTGQMYDRTPVHEFTRRAFKHSLPGALMRNGFRSELYPLMFDLIDFNPGLASNLVPKKALRLADHSLLFDVALFCSLPQPGKRLISNDQRWFLQRFIPPERRPVSRPLRRAWRAKMRKEQVDLHSSYDKNLAGDMEERACPGAAQPVFKYFHMRGLHLPLYMNRECRVQRRLKPTRENFLNQARCCLESIRGMMQTLQRIGLYERTMVIIVGDHGIVSDDEPFGFGRYSPPPEVPGNSRMALIKARAMPLFMVKPFAAGRNDPFRQSRAPVTLGDIPRSVMDALQIEADFPGESVFSLEELGRRTRRFFTSRDFQQAIDREYLVDGPGWLDSSWHLAAPGRAGRHDLTETPPEEGEQP